MKLTVKMNRGNHSEKCSPKYSHCQINYTSSNLAFILPARKAINRFVNEDFYHLKEKIGRKQSISNPGKKKKKKSHSSLNIPSEKGNRKKCKKIKKD